MDNNRIVSSLFKRVYNSDTYYVTDYLSEAEKNEFQEESKHFPGIHLSFYGGFDGSEYEKCAIISDNYEGEIDYKIKVYEILYNKRYLEISHRNILGTVMSLGIERNRIGDIVVKGDKAYLSMDTDIAPYIISNFTVINHTPIELEEKNEIISFYKEGSPKTIFISSDRIDCVIAEAFGLSRSKVSEIFEEGLVKLNSKILLKGIQKIKSCDIISVKSFGRIEIRDFKGTTKSGNMILDIIVYR